MIDELKYFGTAGVLNPVPVKSSVFEIWQGTCSPRQERRRSIDSFRRVELDERTQGQ